MREEMETSLIRSLIQSYFGIVRQTIQDLVPKAIMHLLVINTSQVVQNRLVAALYKPELYALAIGALLPVPFWYWQKRYPKTWLKYFSMPVLLNGPSYIPPALGINYSSWFVVAFIFRES